ncbi:unnamed protein product [Kuraishia capsulata CBS 1993]|uniref:Methyltransferase type 12 domain-containing protein n=1 Tax=Kuraishia capsulata CBS 1993 TaxID=1382522 RepID=W6MLQ4_9ASCO|nr:uncharacterized protein KUCA_T00003427001 [Kuraishia capsulata CBS 1993]CDK27449.1 unnamed protein product [Kuraishia capsulata CBS 1993]
MRKSEADMIPEQTPWQLNQQAIIGLYESCFHDKFEDLERLNQDVQTVKGHLYEREYIQAFDAAYKREAYVLRWSPSRSLAYASLFCYLDDVRQVLVNEPATKVLAIGGGAGGELVALGSVFSQNDQNHQWDVTLMDISNWSDTVARLTHSVHRELCLKPENLRVDFKLGDVLDPKMGLGLAEVNLITLMFTTNELFKENKIGSVNLLHRLNRECKKGALLLIVESAGSYSNIDIGKKTFPVTFLVDMVLCEKGPWTSVTEEDSIWFRCHRHWQYKFNLENMRVLYRLYRHE